MKLEDYKNIPDSAIAIRPIRRKGEKLIYYTATTFTKNPLAGIKLTLNRLNMSHCEPSDEVLLDLLDKDGSVVEDIAISKKQFNRLRRTLGFKVEYTQT